MALTGVFCTGHEHGLASTAGSPGGLYATVQGGFSIVTTAPRNGSYHGRHFMSVSGAQSACFAPSGWATSGQNRSVLRFPVRLITLPGAGLGQMELGGIGNSGGDRLAIRITDAGTVRLVWATSAGGDQFQVDIGTLSVDGLWHLIEARVDKTNTTWVAEGRVDLGTVASVNWTGKTAGGGLGPDTWVGQHTASGMQAGEFYSDDWIVGYSSTGTDWWGDGKVLALRPGADGTHNTAGGNNFGAGDAGTLNFTNAKTDTWTLVDDAAPWTTVRSTTDAVAAGLQTAGAYMEVKPAAGSSPDAAVANCVRAMLAYSSSATQANLAACQVVSSAGGGGGGTVDIWGTINGTGADYSETTNFFKNAIATKPTAGWTNAEVEAVRLRMGLPSGAGDVSPRPTWQALMLEVDYPIAAGTTYTKTGQINPKTMTLGFSATSKEIASAGTISPKASSSGADAFETTETGSLQPKALESGSRNVVLSKTGQVAPKAFASAADVAEYARQAIFGPVAFESGSGIEEFNETGSLLPKAFQSGTSQQIVGGITYTKAGQIGPKASMSGADVFEDSETGTIASKTLASGADVFEATETGTLSPKATSSAADVFEDTEAGTISPKVSASGADTLTTSESGTIAPKTSSSGADVSAFTEAGSITPKALLSGAASTLASSTYTKTGMIAAKASMSGADTVEFSEAGQVSSIATTAGSKSYEATRAGQVSAIATLNASKTQERATAGTLSAVVTLSAQDEATFTRTGSIAIVAFQSGATTKPAIQVTGMLATKPSLSPTAEPFILTIHEGSGLLWIDEQEMRLLKVRHEVEDLE